MAAGSLRDFCLWNMHTGRRLADPAMSAAIAMLRILVRVAGFTCLIARFT